MRFSRRELLLLALITVVAAILRLYRLDDLPPGLCGDTAYKGIGANRILAGEYPIFFEESWGGIEPMYMYLLAGLFAVLGSTPLTIKLLSALIGIVTVPLLYLLVRQMLSSRAVALLASAFLAISYWHISYSRLGWEIILAPVFAIVTLYFLWRGLESGRWKEFVWAGLSLGASLYTYQAMRFLPVCIVAYLAYRILTEKGFLGAYAAKLTLFSLVALVVFLPLGCYFAAHSDTFLRRAREVSIFNPEKNPRGPLQSLAGNAVKTIGMYCLQGDQSSRHNLSGRPAFDILTSAWFILGLLTSVVNRKNPAHSLLLFWLVIMSVPPIISDPWTVPHFSRSVGALPAACVFPAVGLQAAWKRVKARWPSRRANRAFVGVLSALLLASLAVTSRDYFFIWPNTVSLRNDYFDGLFCDVATAMNLLDDPDGVWIVPISALASPHDEPGHYTVEFLYRGKAPFHFLRLDESMVAGDLNTLTAGRDTVMLVDYKNYVLEEAYKYIDADPKRLVPFLLSRVSEEVNTHEFESFDVRVYPLPSGATFSIADSWQGVSAKFGGQLQLGGVSLGARNTGNGPAEALASGEEAWVVLQWRALTQPVADYKVALFLLDQRDRVVGQVDKQLLSNHMRMTSEWEAGQLEMDYYLLPSWPATPPGDYDVKVVVYDPTTMKRLPLLGDDGDALGDSFTAARLSIARPASPPAVEPMHTIEDSTLTADLSLLGYDLPREEVNPGDNLGVALYWSALRDIRQDYLVQLQLRDASGRSWGQDKSRPAYGTYPTSLWGKDEVVRDWHDLRVPAEIPSGEYALHLALESEGAPFAERQLGTIQVSGRVRSYEIPAMEHELGWRLGEEIRLLGYDLETSVRAGSALRMTLYWQCLSEMPASYTVFAHVLDSDNAIIGQADRIPGMPEAPTTSWVEGEVIVDPYEIAVDSEVPPGDYTIEVGLYDAATMERLPVFDSQSAPQGDRILLGSVSIDG